MVEVSKLLHNEKSAAFLSFLVGMGVVVLLFHKPYSSYQFLSIPVSNIEGRIVRHGQKCYTYVAEDCLCPHVNKDARQRSN
jgi:hypothetical protein